MKNSQNLKNLESNVQKTADITKKQALAVYNANLVDSSLNCRGMIIVFKGIIKAVFLGDVKNASEAEKIVYSVLGEETPAVFIDAENLTIMPSFVDMHAHFRYPGQTQKEDLDSGLEAACAGGFGAVVAMPNTKPVVSSGIMAKKIMEEYINLKKEYDKNVLLIKDLTAKDSKDLTTEQMDEIFNQINLVSSNLYMIERNLNIQLVNIKGILKEFENTKNGVIKAKNKHKESKEKYEALVNTITPEINKVKKEMQALESSVDEKLMSKYKALKHDNIFPVFVPLNNGNCGGCRMALPMGKLDKLKTDGYIVCDQCGRVIFNK